SQIKNRAKAMRVLKARLLERAREEQQAAIAADRRSQVGTGERSERIRTYNFPQARVTDHRIGLTLHRLPAVLEGDLDELVDALVPRPETETLVEWALELLPPPAAGRRVLAIDVGTGSGCIACALAAERSDLDVVAIDVSPAAAAVARENVRALQFSARIRVVV